MAQPDNDDMTKAMFLARRTLARADKDLRSLAAQVNGVQEHISADHRAALEEAFRRGVAHAALNAAVAGEALDADRKVRHLELDRDEARARADRLVSERDSLRVRHAALEGELRHARRQLEQVTTQLRHRELDLQRLGVDTGALKSQTPISEAASAEDAAPQKDTRAQKILRQLEDEAEQEPLPPHDSVASLVNDLIRGRRQVAGCKISKHEAMEALGLMRKRIHHEIRRRREAEAREKAEHERVEGLYALVLKQHKDFAAFRQRNGFPPLNSPDDLAAGVSGGANLPPSPSSGPRPRGGGSTFSRQSSVPARLPSVTA